MAFQNFQNLVKKVKIRMSLKEKLPDGWKYSKYREELYCEHGVGHPIPISKKIVHGCCGERCCDPDNDSGWQKAVEIVEREIKNGNI